MTVWYAMVVLVRKGRAAARSRKMGLSESWKKEKKEALLFVVDLAPRLVSLFSKCCINNTTVCHIYTEGAVRGG